MNQPSRRRFLEATATSSILGISAVSGCLGRVASDSQPTETTTAAPDREAPSYRRWLPEPTAVGPDDHDHYRGQYRSLADLRAHADREFSAFHRQRVGDELGFLGVTDSITELVSLSGVGSVRAHVVRGSYDPADVAAAVRESGFSAAGTDGEYDLFRRADPARAVAVADRAVVYGKSEDAAALVDAVIDADRGDRPRYHEVSEPFAGMTATVGEPTFAVAETTEPAPESNPEILQFEGCLGHATGRTLTDDGQRVRYVVPFAEESAENVETVRSAVTADDDLSAVDVSTDGRTVVVDAERAPAN